MQTKTNILALAAAAGLSLSAPATAVVTLDDGDATDALAFASEIDTSGGVLLQEDAAGDQTITNAIGFGVSAGATRFVRIDLSADATFDQNFTAGDLTVSNTGGRSVTAGQISVVAGGQNESFVIFEFTASDGTPFSIGQNGTVTVDIGKSGASGVNVTGTGDVVAEYRLFETGTAASNDGEELASASQTYIEFEQALSLEAGEASEEAIDVVTNGQEFTDDNAPTGNTLQSNIARIQGELATVNWTDGQDVEYTDVLSDADHVLTISGNYGAVPETNTGSPDPAEVGFDDPQNGTIDIAADALTDTEARFNFDLTTLPSPTFDRFVVMNVTGEDRIPQQTLTATLEPGDPANATTDTFNLGAVATLQPNGSQASTNLNLDPNGNFRNFIRVTNRSNVRGSTFITLYNDDGESVSMILGEIPGARTTLDGGASSPVLSVQDVFTTAQELNPDFGLASESRNKFRITVQGNYPEIAIDNITVANDGSTFSTFD